MNRLFTVIPLSSASTRYKNVFHSKTTHLDEGLVPTNTTVSVNQMCCNVDPIPTFKMFAVSLGACPGMSDHFLLHLRLPHKSGPES